MTEQLNYTIFKDGVEHVITITPVIERLPAGDVYITGIFKLTEAAVGMGEIVFDEDMQNWEYNGAGAYLNYADAAEIAGFLQVKNSNAKN